MPRFSPRKKAFLRDYELWMLHEIIPMTSHENKPPKKNTHPQSHLQIGHQQLCLSFNLGASINLFLFSEFQE